VVCLYRGRSLSLSKLQLRGGPIPWSPSLSRVSLLPLPNTKLRKRERERNVGKHLAISFLAAVIYFRVLLVIVVYK